ncbi:MAG TPA: hypothetical protein DIS53_03710 [Candidatus Wildermuthbacteria bacterium]|uniref:POTRA domain-containing protein n=1 Tax=Candidatus Yanofskybacteria bacterium GW2011_GWC1_48_11 TaxID=1619027 RepID=A0A837IMR5_9BACT|nr:MAG: hypothetical protein UY25_C0002G0018 [Candidatus Yanofskybacteria bacterium GW2011_GWC1_48_11]KKW04733.1 MAG: hypothetical protein UY38_C0001G0300 [Parcubacteria group bacterium GW2011_GWB1_49_12]KKW08966.1 MAG: hypothetical protein UY45_C0002G0018 [Parcubacteria group bacterium GW2011_GWA1_49_26]KKW14265.1 MAG: hypothetical protein UY53_C0002G0054 [Parcubacteria group bacterium GW2011_GWA2_50_10]OHA61021.1 MAG: hypothetical protein A2109_02085 [Candidatus Wildermuthbacteria bacterium G
MKRYKPHRRLRPKRARLKKIFQNKVFWYGALGALAFVGVLYGIFFTPLFRIENIEIESNEKISTEDLRRVVEANLSRRVLFFSLNHFLLLDKEVAGAAIEQAFPEAESVAVEKRFPDGVLIRVQERQGIAVWCQQRTLQVQSEDSEEETTRPIRQCFALDEHGVIFEERESEREVIFSAENGEAALGDIVVDPVTLERTRQFQKGVDAFPLFSQVGLRVLSMHIVSKERVHAKISEGWEIYMNPEEKVDWQIAKAKLVLEQEVPFQRRPFLEYLDLRFGDQVYIKYR